MQYLQLYDFLKDSFEKIRFKVHLSNVLTLSPVMLELLLFVIILRQIVIVMKFGY